MMSSQRVSIFNRLCYLSRYCFIYKKSFSLVLVVVYKQKFNFVLLMLLRSSITEIRSFLIKCEGVPVLLLLFGNLIHSIIKNHLLIILQRVLLTETKKTLIFPQILGTVIVLRIFHIFSRTFI